jgi:hypothetical protein
MKMDTPIQHDLSGACALTLSQSAEAVEAYDFVEATIQDTGADAPNPFTDVTLARAFGKTGVTVRTALTVSRFEPWRRLPHPLHASAWAITLLRNLQGLKLTPAGIAIGTARPAGRRAPPWSPST